MSLLRAAAAAAAEPRPHALAYRSATFGNRCLCRQPDQLSDDPDEVCAFTCDVLEVWGMDHGTISRRQQTLRQQG
eukprot:3151324-Prymnesium_polylepis.1